MPRLSALVPALVLGCALLAFAHPAAAQQSTLDPKFGVGFDGVISFGNDDLINGLIGLGLRGRVSFPVNADLSFAADAGFVGFVLGGRDDATYVFNPQVSAILTFPALGEARYLLGGLGFYAPLGGSGDTGGPALHLGMGWVVPLRETALYVEVDPSLVVGESQAALVVPVRVGVIF